MTTARTPEQKARRNTLERSIREGRAPRRHAARGIPLGVVDPEDYSNPAADVRTGL